MPPSFSTARTSESAMSYPMASFLEQGPRGLFAHMRPCKLEQCHGLRTATVHGFDDERVESMSRIALDVDFEPRSNELFGFLAQDEATGHKDQHSEAHSRIHAPLRSSGGKTDASGSNV